MRPLIMWNLVTLDGLFEGAKPWDLEWHEAVWGDELERLSIEQLHSADTLVFGRATYEGMARYWQSETGEVADLMNGIQKVVFSRTIDKAAWQNTRLVKGDPVAEIGKLKKQPGKTMFVFGSANLCATLMQHDLIDEYRLALTPLILGSGTPLFKSGQARMKLRLLHMKSLKSGCVILRYAPERSEP